MKDSEENRITRWIDGELEDEDVRDLLDARPEWREDKEAAHRMGHLLRQEMTSPDEDAPYPDFFNHRIQKRIEEEEFEMGSEQTWQAFPMLMRTRRLAGIAACALVVVWIGMITGWFGLGLPSHSTKVVEVYTPNPNHSSNLRFSSRTDTAILELQGLDAVPEAQTIAGYFDSPDGPRVRESIRSTMAMVNHGFLSMSMN